ncbi:MAG: J domain-containing protein [Terracidiphilus sp.]|jgi:hypothetical protein
MNACLCGDLVDVNGARCPRCTALHALDLDSNASEAEIRRAYHLLVKVWHPDRFQSDPNLKESAGERLQQINSAFEFLTSTSTERGAWRPPARAKDETISSLYEEQQQATVSAQATSAIPVPIPPLRLGPILRVCFKLAIIAVALLLGRYLWIAFDVPVSPNDAAAQVYHAGKENLLKSLEAPKQRFIAAVNADLRGIGLKSPAPVMADNPQDAAPQPAQLTTPAAQNTSAHPAKTTKTSPPTPRKILPYITVGSTRDEVLAMQGPPSASTGDKLVYGKSELYFKDGALVGWRVESVAAPVRLKLWPSSAIDPALAAYSYGASKDVVLTVQGTPTAFTADKFEYGRSAVYFRNNRVVGWKEDPDSAPLWAR